MAKSTGRVISKQIMQDEIDKYLYFRSKTHDAIQAAIDPIAAGEGAGEAAMRAHFSGTETSFIFDKATITKFLEDIEGGTSNALRIYLGAKVDDGTGAGITVGSRTLVIVPARISYHPVTQEITAVDNVLLSDAVAAIEYPGGVKTEAQAQHIPDEVDSKPGNDVTNMYMFQM